MIDYCELDLGIIRGLDYYTGTVFEAWARTGLRRALFGGGRYDNLTQQVGGKKKIPGVGFAAGDMSLRELLIELDKYPPLLSGRANALVTVFSPELINRSIELAKALRTEGIPVEMYPEANERLDRQIRYADRCGIPFVIIVGPDELKRNAYTLKNLDNRTQKMLDLDGLTDALK